VEAVRVEYSEELRRLKNREETRDPGMRPGGIRERGLEAVYRRLGDRTEIESQQIDDETASP
jgi:hypothetical protein